MCLWKVLVFHMEFRRSMRDYACFLRKMSSLTVKNMIINTKEHQKLLTMKKEIPEKKELFPIGFDFLNEIFFVLDLGNIRILQLLLLGYSISRQTSDDHILSKLW